MNVCRYQSMRDYNLKAINDRFKTLFTSVCNLSGSSGSGGTLQDTTTLGNTSTNDIEFVGSKAVFSPDASEVFLEVNPVTSFVGSRKFQFHIDESANPGGTYNYPVSWGFNLGGRLDPTLGGNGFSMEPYYKPAGTVMTELHYISRVPNGSDIRLMSSTFGEGTTEANSSNLWYFKGNPFEIRQMGSDNAYASFTPDGMKLYNPLVSTTDYFQTYFHWQGAAEFYATVGLSGAGSNQMGAILFDSRAGVADPIRFQVGAAASAPTIPLKIKADGTLNYTGVQAFADNAAALVGGLTVGDIYRTGDLLKIVH